MIHMSQVILNTDGLLSDLVIELKLAVTCMSIQTEMLYVGCNLGMQCIISIFHDNRGECEITSMAYIRDCTHGNCKIYPLRCDLHREFRN